MCATNGVVLLCADLAEYHGGDVTLPLAAVDALLQLKAAPHTLAVTDTSAVFRYDGMILVASLLAHTWPDLSRLLADIGEQSAVPDGLADAIKRVKPFCPNSEHAIIRLTADGNVCTADGDSSGSQAGFTFAQDTSFDADWLLSVLTLATTIDFAKYPAAVPFAGDGVRGVIMGTRL